MTIFTGNVDKKRHVWMLKLNFFSFSIGFILTEPLQDMSLHEVCKWANLRENYYIVQVYDSILIEEFSGNANGKDLIE